MLQARLRAGYCRSRYVTTAARTPAERYLWRSRQAIRGVRWYDRKQHERNLISLARDYIGAFQLNHAVFIKALLLRNGTKFSEAAGKIVANFKNDALFSFDNLGRLSEVEFVV